MKSHFIDFEPIGRRGRCQSGQSLLDCARQLGIELVSICGGNGTCGMCKIQILAGLTSELASVEREKLSKQEIEAGYRLACQTCPLEDCRIHVPPASLTTPQRTQLEGLQVDIHPEPIVDAYHVMMHSPSLQDSEADADRLLEALQQQHQISCSEIDIKLLQELSPRLRSSGWQIQAVVRGDEIVAVGPWPSQQLGFAVDLGTTKVAGYLLDLSTGQVLASQGIMNPQIACGEDVITRIARARGSRNEAIHLQRLAVNAIDQLANDLSTEIGAVSQDIIEVVVVGNTAMHHLLLGLSVEQLALSPYVPAIKGKLDIKARDIGLNVAPGAYVHLLPNIAGFVGADHVAMLLAKGTHGAEGVLLALDIGTNTEVCLVNDGRMTSVSCASGPAFEGAHITHGMRATSGAIEHVRLVGDGIEIQTIGGMPPAGLCGSGILDAIAQLYLAGILDASGRMTGDQPRVRVREGEREFVLVSEEERHGEPAIVITQKDVREVQLAKAAIRTGIQALLQESDRVENEIEQIIIAGAFGSYMNTASAVTIGMLPPLPLNRFRQVGNAAGMGAKLALISMSKRVEAQAIASRVGYIELAAAPSFARIFAQANYLGKYRIIRGKREGIE